MRLIHAARDIVVRSFGVPEVGCGGLGLLVGMRGDRTALIGQASLGGTGVVGIEGGPEARLRRAGDRGRPRARLHRALVVGHRHRGPSFRHRSGVTGSLCSCRADRHGADHGRLVALPDGSVRRVDAARHPDRHALDERGMLEIDGRLPLRQGIARDRQPDLARGRPSPDQVQERRADGDAEAEADGQEEDLGGVHRSIRIDPGWAARIVSLSVAATTRGVNLTIGRVAGAVHGGSAEARTTASPRVGHGRDGRFRPVRQPPDLAPQRIGKASHLPVAIDQDFLVQPVNASWLQCNIECQEACPVGTNCRGYLNLAAEGRFEEGYVLSREPNPVAAMCAYVCSAPCERACRRGDIDRPLAIRAMKRFLVEWHEASGIPDEVPIITPQDTKVAVVGAGPAGIAVARELATAGHQVTVFDELPFAGGTMLIGVPAFRLPREAIEMDVRLVERLGVRFRFDTRIGRDITFEQLQADFDAIAICAGAMDPVGLDVPGSDLEGIQYGVDFMKKANLGQALEVGSDVVVIGGGYTAMDCSRTSLRHGAANVTIAYRRTRSELVVDEEELGETEREGVRMEFLASPVEVLGEDGKVTGVRFIRNRLGEPDATGRRSPVPIAGSEFVIAAQTVIPAVSQAADNTFLPVESSFEINRGRVKVDPGTYASNVKGVFACGDFVTGPTTLIEAAGHGKKCAYAIDRYLAGRSTVRVDANVRIVSSWRHEMPELYDVLPRQHVPMTPLQDRIPSTDPVVNFNTQVEQGYGVTEAVAESTRCLMCNYNIWFDPFRCVLCGACADVCPGGRHPHDRRQPDEGRRRAAGARRCLRLGSGRGHGPRRGALHPLRAVRQAMPL